MNKLNIFDLKGKEAGNAELPKELHAEPNRKLLAQAIHVYRDRKHAGSAYAKTRSEVDITKKKIYRQKGTGGARHGAASAHIFVGGGVVHGPKGIKRELILPQEMRRKAMRVALSMKAENGKVSVVSDLSKITKTADFKAILKQFSNKGKTRLTVVLAEENAAVYRALRNVANMSVIPVKSLNAYDVFFGGMILLDSALVASEKKTATKKTTARKATK